MDRSPRRRSAAKARQASLAPDPLPLEIVIACERFRRAWSPQEREARAPHLSPRSEWHVPVIGLGSLDAPSGGEEGGNDS